MNEDSRCCGSGTCIIDIEGRCWCGRQWGDQKTGPARFDVAPAAAEDAAAPSTCTPPPAVRDL